MAQRTAPIAAWRGPFAACRVLPGHLLLGDFGEGFAFCGDGGVLAVSGPDGGVRGEGEEPFADGGQDGGVVAVGAAGGAGSAVEQGVPGEHGPLGVEVEAGGAG